MGQVTRDRALREEESGCHLGVRLASPDEVGDTAFRRRQTVRARATADPAELDASLLGPARSSELDEGG